MSGRLSALPPLVIRADADAIIGSGHVMRCLALAQEWKKRGGTVWLVGRLTSEEMRGRLAAEGICLQLLDLVFPDESDLAATARLIAEVATEEQQTPWLMVDGYHFSPAYHQALRRMSRLLLLDDDARLPCYHADMLLNQNAGSESMRYCTDGDTRLLLGNRYLLLRHEFRAMAQRGRHDFSEPRHLLVTMGGADHAEATELVLQALLARAPQSLPPCTVKVVVGPANPRRESIERLLRHAPFPVELHWAVENMAALMQWADCALSAAGSTCWELAACGVPMALLVTADNQQPVAYALRQAGAALYLGKQGEHDREWLAARLAELLGDGGKLRSMSDAASTLVDGKGVARVIEALVPTPISFRAVEERDRQMVFDWATDSKVRAVSLNSAPISWEDHCRWFAAKLSDSRCAFWVISGGEKEALGQVRFDEQGEHVAMISISLAPAWRDLGLGGRVIAAACRIYCDQREKTSVRAVVRLENETSLSAFLKAGFRVEREGQQEGVAVRELVWWAEESHGAKH